MDKEVDRILKDALALPPEARGELIESLLRSLDDTVDEGVEEAWAKEIERRMDDIKSGRAKLIPWAEVRTRLWATGKNDR